jgi:hypothetical protein
MLSIYLPYFLHFLSLGKNFKNLQINLSFFEFHRTKILSSTNNVVPFHQKPKSLCICLPEVTGKREPIGRSLIIDHVGTLVKTQGLDNKLANKTVLWLNTRRHVSLQHSILTLDCSNFDVKPCRVCLESSMKSLIFC